jgi:hypothetical protein
LVGSARLVVVEHPTGSWNWASGPINPHLRPTQREAQCCFACMDNCAEDGLRYMHFVVSIPARRTSHGRLGWTLCVGHRDGPLSLQILPR